MIIWFFGTGSSEGIPAVGCNCDLCSEAIRYPFLERRQISMLLMGKKESNNILIDVGFDVTKYIHSIKLKAIYLTHWHHDHFVGLYPLRWTVKDLPLFSPRDNVDSEILRLPKGLKLQFIDEPFQKIKIDDFDLTPIPLNHSIETYGLVIKAYGKAIGILFDTKNLPKETKEYLLEHSFDILIVDATFSPDIDNKIHNNIDEALKIIKSIEPKKSYLIHISHRNLPYFKLLEYIKLNANNQEIHISLDNQIIKI